LAMPPVPLLADLRACAAKWEGKVGAAGGVGGEGSSKGCSLDPKIGAAVGVGLGGGESKGCGRLLSRVRYLGSLLRRLVVQSKTAARGSVLTIEDLQVMMMMMMMMMMM
jgi:hypothetical protein